MADTREPRPPVIVGYSIEWSRQDAREHDTFEIDRDEWDAMTPAERNRRCEEGAQEALDNAVEWGWDIKDPADYAATEEAR